ncbi:MAG: superfamily protein, partial [bacterium]
PGLIVNLILKDHWGRPRPSTIAEFFGPNHYVPPFLISDQCLDNCSFPSGHAALGFWLVAFALLTPPVRRRRALWAALVFGAMVGLVRIAQGGHFLSDVLVSGMIVVGLTCWLHGRMVPGGDVLTRKNNHPERSESP